MENEGSCLCSVPVLMNVSPLLDRALRFAFSAGLLGKRVENTLLEQCLEGESQSCREPVERSRIFLIQQAYNLSFCDNNLSFHIIYMLVL